MMRRRDTRITCDLSTIYNVYFMNINTRLQWMVQSRDIITFSMILHEYQHKIAMDGTKTRYDKMYYGDVY